MINEYNLPSIQKLDKESDLEFSKRKRYREIYIKLINKYKSIDLKGDIFTEVHHILPRCMGGSNSAENLIILPVKHHIFAHYILSCIYPDNYKLGYAMTMFNERCKGDNLGFSIRSITKFREAWRKSLRSDECRKHRSELQLGEKNSNYGVKTSDEIKEKISKGNKAAWKKDYERLKSFIGSRGTHNCARRVMGPDGTIYPCLADAVDQTGIPNSTLRGWMKGLTKDNHGWSYVDPRNNKKEFRNSHSD
jgi:hypothetical protein